MAACVESVDEKKPSFVLPGPELLALPGLDLQRASITSAALSDVPSDVIIKSRIRYGSRLSACKGLLLEYSKSTTIHGIRYIFEVHRPIYEKCVSACSWTIPALTALSHPTSQTLLAGVDLHLGLLCGLSHLGHLPKVAGLARDTGLRRDPGARAQDTLSDHHHLPGNQNGTQHLRLCERVANDLGEHPREARLLEHR